MRIFKPLDSPVTWKLPDPDTGYLHTGRSLSELVKFIVSYRSQNGLKEIAHLDIVISNYLCSLPENVGKCKSIKIKRGILQYLKGGVALLENIFYGEANMVPQEEADRRAAICVDCPCNVFPDRGTFLQWTDDMALHAVGDRKSTYHDKLGSCEGCTCVLKSKIFFKGHFKLSKDEEDKMQECSAGKCWQLHIKET